MANITLDGLPAKTGTIDGAGILHLRESGVDKKVTVTAFLAKIAAQYNAVVTTFLAATSKAEMRAAMDIARRTAVSNADYTILVTDKIVVNTGALTAARVFTLPAASAYPAGEELIVSDQSFTANQAFSISLARAGSDTFHDGTTSQVINQKGGKISLISDGTSVWTVLFSGNVFAPLTSNKNAIINGDFNVWQRGTSFATIADGDYSADRFQYNKSMGTGVHTVSRSTDVPTVAQAGRLFNYSLLADCTTAEAAVAAGEYCFIRTKIEGYNWLPLAQKTFAFSFWVKATKTGTYCVAFRNSGGDRSYVAEYTINTTDTWEYKTVTVTASPSAGTWDYINGIGLDVAFVLAGGSTYQTTAGAWATGNYFSTSSQVNGVDSTSNDFKICGIQLEAGAVATPFENRSRQLEVTLCQRYYEKSYDLGTAPATTTDPGRVGSIVNNGKISIKMTFQTRKRTTPSITHYSPVTGTSGKLRNYDTGADMNIATDSEGETGYDLNNGGYTSGQSVGWHWTANSEL